MREAFHSGRVTLPLVVYSLSVFVLSHCASSTPILRQPTAIAAGSVGDLWIIEPFDEAENWLDVPQSATVDSVAWGMYLSERVYSFLRNRSHRALLSEKRLSPFELKQLVAERLRYVCGGAVERLTFSPGESESNLAASYSLRKLVNGKLVLVAKETLVVRMRAREPPSSLDLEQYLNALAEKIGERIVEETISDLMVGPG